MKPSTLYVLFLPLFVLAAAPSALADVLAVTHQDFTLTQATAGFQYGYYTEANATAGTFSTADMTSNGTDWRGSESSLSPVVGPQWMHPGISALTPAVRRYTVGIGGEPSFTGTVRITGRFYSTDSGLTNRFVTVNGTTLFVDNNKNGETTFDVSATVSDGSTIDLGVAPGADASSDSVNLMAWIVTPDTSFATQLVGSAYNSPGDRDACLALATDGVLGSSDAQTFDTGAGPAFPYQFAGLFYAEGATSGMATRLDSVRLDVVTTNDFADVPRLYVLRHNSDPNTSNPAADDRYARLPVVPVRNAANTAGQPYYTFDLTSLAATERTGYGFAVVGEAVNSSTPIVFSEIAAVASRVADTAVIAPLPFYVSAAGHRYARSVLRGDWEQVKSDALSYGANLVQIDDATENQLMVDLFGSSEILFIGLYKSPADPATSASYKWTTGAINFTPLGAYQNWLPGQPDSFGGKDDYVEMNYGGAGLWANMGIKGHPETGDYHGIIELPTPGSGTPSFIVASVPATSNIFGAGLASAPGGGTLPPSIDVSGLSGQEITFPQIVGVLDTSADRGGPDGPHTPGRSCDFTAVGGISGYLNGNNAPALVGVFLAASQPASPPARIDFSTNAAGENFASLAPELGQVFFIGDGFTNSGVAQKFTIPAGATKLYFGITDGNNGTLYHGTPSDWGDNSGSVSIRATIGGNATPTIVGASFPLTGGQLIVSGGTGPYTVTLLSGSLPAGVTISSTGLVTGTVGNGTYTFTIHVVDSLGASSDRTYSFVVENPILATQGLAAWWPGEGAVGDIIGGFHGSLKNGATYGDGKVGRAFSFDGVDDYLEVTGSSAMNLGGDLTIEGWIKPANVSGFATIIGKRSADASSIAYQLYLTNGQLSFDSTLGNMLAFDFVDAPMTANAWHHVAATLAGGQLSLYVDGSLLKTVAWSGARAAVSEPATIGATIDTAHPTTSPSSAFPGAIDELSLSTRALTPSEVTAIFNAGAAGRIRNDAAREYSTTNNDGPVWSYRWIPSTDVDAVYDPNAANTRVLSGPNPTGGNGINGWGSNPAVNYNTTNNPVTVGQAYDWTPRQFGMHPGPSGEYAVLRWKATQAGQYAVSGTFYGADSNPSTTDVHIFHNATQLTPADKRLVNSYRGDGVSHTQVIAVAANDTVDFLVGPGGNGYSSDSTGLAASVVPLAPTAPPDIQVKLTYGSAGEFAVGELRDFGPVQVNEYYAHAIEIKNTGEAPLANLVATITGVNAAEYSLVPIQPLSSLAAGESIGAWLYVQATSIGTKSAALHITSNDPDEPDFYINLTAVGFDGSTAERVDSLQLSPDDSVRDIQPASGGKSIVVGHFTHIGGQLHNRIARLNADGSVDGGFQGGADGDIITAAIQADGKIIVGGIFTSVSSTNGTHLRTNIARFNADGTVDTGWFPSVDGPVYSLAIEASGTLLVGGNFTTVNAATLFSHICRLDLTNTGSVFGSFTPVFSAPITKVLSGDGGKILVGGTFAAVGTPPRSYLAQLQADGTSDPFFVPPVFNSSVETLARDATSGKIYVGGNFTLVNNAYYQHIVRLLPDGTVDGSFSSSVLGGEVRAIQLQPDGKVLIGGRFNEVWSSWYGWMTSHRIARLLANGEYDWTFPAQAGATDWAVYTIAPTASGNFIGGNFSTMGGLPRTNLARGAPPVPDIHVLSTGAITHTDGSTRDFGTKFVGGGFNTIIFTLQNVGMAPLTGFSGAGGVTIDGSNAVAFSLSGAGVTSLNTGGSTTITVNFTPQGTGAHEAWLHIHSNDPDEEPFDIKLIGTGGVPISDWRQTYFGTNSDTGDAADDADPDHDGIANLMEFATGGSPNTNTPSPQRIEAPTTGFVDYLYSRNKLAMAELTYTVEWNDVLSTTGWSSAGVTETILSDDGVTQQVRARVPTGGNDHRFIQLKVTR